MADSEQTQQTQTTEDRDPASNEEHHSFEAEVSRLLELMVHSVYSDREIFLRELISNASDACDKLRYEAITDPELTRDDPDFRIRVTVDPKGGTMTVSDNGVGMDHGSLVSDLGTIARSGTQAFADRLTGDNGQDLSLIGQFGVGFYSSFMVAETVRVRSRRAGADEAHEWESDGRGDYVVRPAERAGRGTDVILSLKEDAREFLDKSRLETILRKYSDHIGVPIILVDAGEDSGETAEEKPVNDASALWTRPKSEISEEQYTEFYRHVSHALDTPALTVHNKAEGVIAYTSMLFVPSQRPMDLFDPARKPRVKLYVKRVFITEDTEALLPGYLRFLRGVIDSEDLPLNISREMLQTNPVIRRLNKAITNRILGELEKLAGRDRERFETIWANFGPVLKEGVYEDAERREQLLKLARFRSTGVAEWTSLEDYVSRMKDGQKAIYYVTGQDAEAVTRSPQLEGFKARGIEVLLLSDPVDDFWLSATQDFEGKPFKSITRGASDLKDLGGSPESGADEDRPGEGEIAKLVTVLKQVLGEAVSDVRGSDRLTETPACLVADEQGLDMHLERILRQHQQLGADMAKVLEINPGHPLIAAMSARAQEDGAAEALSEPAQLLLDQARVLEGEPPSDPAAFAKRLSAALEASLRG